MQFADRRDAGRRLAVELEACAAQRPVILALPRGGVPVALEVSRALRAPLEILAVRKLGAPGNPELGVAIAGCNIDVVDTITQQYLKCLVGFLLRDFRQARGPKNGARALVSRSSEQLFSNHG